MNKELPEFIKNIEPEPIIYSLGANPFINGKFLSKKEYQELSGRNHDITIERRGTDSWAICDKGVTLNRNFEWEYEGLSSGRTQEYLNNNRYSSVEEALMVFKNYIYNTCVRENLWTE